MDLNGDGRLDILSGSYSRHDRDMAGLFQVLFCQPDGAFQQPQVLTGTDGEPLILPAGKGQSDVIDKICTRPFACDLDGDGKLDLVAGNFRGTFGFFKGEGDGKFAPQASWLQAAGSKMSVPAHSDPFLIDWDGDGDLDLLSGSSRGGAFLFINKGNVHEPEFGQQQTLLAAAGHGSPTAEPQFGDEHLRAPASGTRVWVDDVDGDGKFDLLIGDQITLQHLADGVDEATAKQLLAAWTKREQKLLKSYPQGDDKDAQVRWQKDYELLNKHQAKFIRKEATGFVWLLRQK